MEPLPSESVARGATVEIGNRSHCDSASLQNPATIRGRHCTSVQFPISHVAGTIACEVQVDASQGDSIVGATFTGDEGVVLAILVVGGGLWWWRRSRK